MPGIILGISCFLVVAAIVVPLIAERLDSRAIRDKRDLARTTPPHISISEAFDPVYSILWEAPIAALEMIDSGGLSGVPASRLKPIYEKAAGRFPEIYEGSGFAPWLLFLEEMGLISWHRLNVVLTPKGQEFLRHRFVTDTLAEV